MHIDRGGTPRAIEFGMRNAECGIGGREHFERSDYPRKNQCEAQRSGFALERTNNGVKRMSEPARTKRSGVCEDDGGKGLTVVIIFLTSVIDIKIGSDFLYAKMSEPLVCFIWG